MEGENDWVESKRRKRKEKKKRSSEAVNIFNVVKCAFLKTQPDHNNMRLTRHARPLRGPLMATVICLPSDINQALLRAENPLGLFVLLRRKTTAR